MLRSLRVGLDGSASSERATELGIAWARRFDALLVGLSVVDELTIRGPIPAVRGVPYAESVAYALEQARVAGARRRVEQFPGAVRAAVRRGERGPQANAGSLLSNDPGTRE